MSLPKISAKSWSKVQLKTNVNLLPASNSLPDTVNVFVAESKLTFQGKLVSYSLVKINPLSRTSARLIV